MIIFYLPTARSKTPTVVRALYWESTIHKKTYFGAGKVDFRSDATFTYYAIAIEGGYRRKKIPAEKVVYACATENCQECQSQYKFLCLTNK